MNKINRLCLKSCVRLLLCKTNLALKNPKSNQQLERPGRLEKTKARSYTSRPKTNVAISRERASLQIIIHISINKRQRNSTKLGHSKGNLGETWETWKPDTRTKQKGGVRAEASLNGNNDWTTIHNLWTPDEPIVNNISDIFSISTNGSATYSFEKFAI
jgi:hypothetical protein